MMPLGRWYLSSDAEKELDAFLEGLPAAMRKELEQGLSSFSKEDWRQEGEWLLPDPWRRDAALKEFLRLVQRVPARLREYRKRERRESNQLLTAWLPKIPAGRPPDSKAQDYLEQHAGELSYADIAKQELQSEPEGEAKMILIKKEKERIRASVRRSRRRQGA
jgi:hypothetical protein